MPRSQAVNAFIDLAIEKQKALFHSDVESFDSFSHKLRREMEKYFHTFHAQFYGGYEVLVRTLDHEKRSDLPAYHITEEAWQHLQDPDLLFERFNEGKTLQDILGLSFEAVKALYTAACSLFDAKRMPEARNGFFFLTTIAPHIPECWLAKSSTHLELHEYDDAIEAAEEAHALAPEKAEAFLSLIRVYVKMHDFEKALHICKEAMHKAAEQPHCPWAEMLRTSMEAAKQYIEQKRIERHG